MSESDTEKYSEKLSYVMKAYNGDSNKILTINKQQGFDCFNEDILDDYLLYRDRSHEEFKFRMTDKLMKYHHKHLKKALKNHGKYDFEKNCFYTDSYGLEGVRFKTLSEFEFQLLMQLSARFGVM
jgi:beta-mannanase